MTNLRKSSLVPAGSSLPGSALPASEVAPDSLPDQDPSTGFPAPAPAASEVVTLSAGDQGLTYRPTEAQQRVKARFWARWGDVPGKEPTLAAAKQLTGSAALGEWWSKPGFKEWFLLTSVTEERLEYLLHLALSAAEDVLLNTDPKGQGARVQMVKVVAEMSGRLKKTGPAGDTQAAKQLAAVGQMDRNELIKLLQDSGLRVEQTVNLPSTTKDN